MRTQALCAIICVAVALNRCHNNAVKAVHLIQDGEKCVLVRDIILSVSRSCIHSKFMT